MRAWVLKSRPNGMPQPSDFELATLPDARDFTSTPAPSSRRPRARVKTV